MKKIFLDEKLQAEFLRKGYVTAPLLSDRDLANLLNEFHILHPVDNFAPRGEDESRFIFHTTLLDSDIEYKRKTNRLLRNFFARCVREILVDYRILTGAFIIKRPDKGEVSVHRDWTFTDNFHDININFWCPLVDVDETNGTLQMVDGTHQLVPNISCPQTKAFFSGFSASLQKHSTAIPLKAGEALLFDSSILHWSTPNKSAAQRPAVSFMCISQKAKPVFYYPDKTTAGKRFEVFEMSSESFDEHTGDDFLKGNIRTKRIGFVENKNQAVSEEEFFGLVARGDEIRHRIYHPQPEKKTIRGFSLLGKMRAMLGI